MIRSIKGKLSVKVFLITFILLGVACSGTYFCISKLLPTTYTKLINQTTETAAIQLVDQLAAYDNISDCGEALSDFHRESYVLGVGAKFPKSLSVDRSGFRFSGCRTVFYRRSRADS